MSSRFVPWSKKTLLPLILPLLGFFIQLQIVYNVKMFGNKDYRYNEGPLYFCRVYIPFSHQNFRLLNVIDSVEFLHDVHQS